MPQVYNVTRRGLPSANADGAQVQIRGGRYGEQHVIPVGNGTYPIAEEGAYYKALTPTLGTAVAYPVTAAFSATAGAAFLIRNANASPTGPNIYLDYVRFTFSVAPASSTSAQFAVVVDPANRYTSGGSALTITNPNLNTTPATSAVAFAGSLTTTAASGSVRNISRGALKATIPLVGDSFTVNFGAVDSVATSSGVQQGGPVVLGPNANHSMLVHLWFPANATTGASFEVDAGWWER
jgi:hypothetical protein